MKKIITLTMISNQADIIETFARYTMNFASKMIFIDNGCVDGGIEILHKLKAEGFKIEIYAEAQKYYDQYLIENKYIKKITDENTYDFLLPLDVDEFLASDKSLLEDLETLSEDKITMLNWRTYCLTGDEERGFFLDQITHVRINEEKVFTKVLIPYSMLRKHHLFVTMGHHDIEGESEIAREYQETLYIAHFPVRDIEQIRLKIYQGTIGQLMSSYQRVVAFHWQRIHEELKQGKFDIVKYSKEYAVPENQDMDRLNFEEQKFDYSWCKHSIMPQYEELQKQDILEIIYEMAQVLAIKSVVYKKRYGKMVLIYGTGGTARNLFDYINMEEYHVLAYVDSDVSKEYSQFRGKLVIAPDKIKYLDYDVIIVASKYFDEIYDVLLKIGVNKKKIFSRYDMISEQLMK